MMQTAWMVTACVSVLMFVCVCVCVPVIKAQ